MTLQEVLDICSKTDSSKKTEIMFWSLWTYAKSQRDKIIKNQCIYECYCLANNFMEKWNPEYKEFYERVIQLSVNEYDELVIKPKEVVEQKEEPQKPKSIYA